jgi:hypothetical protein
MRFTGKHVYGSTSSILCEMVGIAVAGQWECQRWARLPGEEGGFCHVLNGGNVRGRVETRLGFSICAVPLYEHGVLFRSAPEQRRLRRRSDRGRVECR